MALSEYPTLWVVEEEDVLEEVVVMVVSFFLLTVSPSEFSLSYHMSLSNNTNFVRNIPPKLVRRATIQEKTFKKVTSYSLRVFIQADLWYKNKENIYTFKHWNNVVIHSTMSN